MLKFIDEEKIETESTKILKENNLLKMPIRVEKLAENLGLFVDYIPLQDDVSGLLLLENIDGIYKGFIGINIAHSSVRQRFTIAHEIGHYILHCVQLETLTEVFIDKKFKRDPTSSEGTDRKEIQANLFASFLLMPKEILENHIKGFDFDLIDDLILSQLARDFEVSLQAMSIRLSKLGWNL
jgi:Zn-dependent peptidase ImmA (M78 family)